MRNRITLVIALVALFSYINASGSTLLIENTTIVSSERASILKGQNVLIENDQIISIEPYLSAASKPQLDRIIDGKNKYLTPGLIDSHVHLQGVPGMLPAHERKYPKLVEQAKAQIPRSYLYFGFTTVLDLFSSKSAIDQWNSQELRPDAYFCNGVPLANGYPMAWVPKEHRFKSEAAEYFLFDKRQENSIPDALDRMSHMPLSIIDRISSSGASCVKTFFEKGFGRLQNLPNPTLEMIQPLVSQANKKGLPVFMHANTQAAQQFAIEAGVDVIAHGMWHWDQKLAGEPSESLKSMIDDIVARDIAYQATIQVIYGEQELFNDSFFTEPLVAHSIPQELISWYQSEEGKWMQGNIAANMFDKRELVNYEKVKQRYALVINRAQKVLSLLAEQNARLLFGSDTPSGPLFTQLHGMNGRLEMQRWIEAGVSLEQLFKALTIDNARALGLSEQIGTVEAGKKANLLLLNDNPLKTISAYDKIDSVIINGKLIDRARLSAVKAH